jgi:hypothetical protein
MSEMMGDVGLTKTLIEGSIRVRPAICEKPPLPQVTAIANHPAMEFNPKKLPRIDC